MADYPDNYAYTREHEWVAVEGDIATVGVTDHAQQELGDVVFVELPEPGTTVEKGAPFGTIESVKAVSDLYAPLSGEVTEVHDQLIEEPEIANTDPHGAGWMIRIRMHDAAELEDLMSAESYLEFVKE